MPTDTTVPKYQVGQRVILHAGRNKTWEITKVEVYGPGDVLYDLRTTAQPGEKARTRAASEQKIIGLAPDVIEAKASE